MSSGASRPSLITSLDHWARLQPDAPFLSETDENREVTYGGFARAVARLQQAWDTDSPLTIALALPGGIPAALIWIAALTGGHRLIPCAPEATEAERRLLAARHHPHVVVVAEADEAEKFGRAGVEVVTSKELYALAAGEQWGDRRMDSAPPRALAGNARSARTGRNRRSRTGTLQLTTSGTTGEPKGVSLTADQIAWTADQVRRSHGLTTSDRGLCVLPFFHINAPVVSLSATLISGGSLVIAPRFSLHRFWGWVEDEQITWASIVPTIVALLLSTEKPAFLPGRLRFLRTASAPLPIARHLAFEERFNLPLVETYGLSEAASQVTANPVPPGVRKVGSVGLPTGVKLRICVPDRPDRERSEESVASTLRDAATGEEGEICVRGPSVISRYTGRRGARSFKDGWFRTGDLGYQDAEGYVYITGRLREVINRGGEKVSPREIEEVLLASPFVRDAAVTSEPDPLYGQRIVAYVVLAEDQDDVAGAGGRLRDFCLEHLSAYKVPETFYIVPALPRNGNGKLARRSLEAMQASPPPSLVPSDTSLLEGGANDRRRGVMVHG